MTINLPRLSSAAPIVQKNDTAAQQFVGQWNALCNAIETNENALAAQQAQIDEVLGLANGAVTDAALAQALANYLSHLTQQPIASGQLLANATGASAVPTGTALSALMDLVFGNAQGNVLYRGASAWAALAPGTSGNVLTTGGAGANPAWGTAGGGGGLVGTYHDETASRAIGTTYTNTQSTPIFISVMVAQSGAGQSELILYVDGNPVFYTNGPGSANIAVVGFANSGDTYEVVQAGTSVSLENWWERY